MCEYEGVLCVSLSLTLLIQDLRLHMAFLRFTASHSRLCPASKERRRKRNTIMVGDKRRRLQLPFLILHQTPLGKSQTVHCTGSQLSSHNWKWNTLLRHEGGKGNPESGGGRDEKTRYRWGEVEIKRNEMKSGEPGEQQSEARRKMWWIYEQEKWV